MRRMYGWSRRAEDGTHEYAYGPKRPPGDWLPVVSATRDPHRLYAGSSDWHKAANEVLHLAQAIDSRR